MKKKEEKKENNKGNKIEEKTKNLNKINKKNENKEEINDNNKDFCCSLKWKGMVKKKNFWNFQILIKKDNQELMQYLVDTDLIHLYNNIN